MGETCEFISIYRIPVDKIAALIDEECDWWSLTVYRASNYYTVLVQGVERSENRNTILCGDIHRIPHPAISPSVRHRALFEYIIHECGGVSGVDVDKSLLAPYVTPIDKVVQTILTHSFFTH